MAQQTEQTFLIPAANLGELNFRIEKLNKRAAKLGAEPVAIEVVQVVTKKQKDGSVSRYFQIDVTGVAPKLPGWTFLGTLQHTDAGNILRSVPGREIPESYRNAARTCDHCKKIRNRKDTYIVLHDDGSIKQVGHSCVRDFLGHVDPRHLAAMAELIKVFREAQEDGFSDGWVRSIDYTEQFLGMVVEVIKRDGWVSKSAATKYAEASDGRAYLSSTASAAMAYLHPTVDMKRRGDLLNVSEESLKTALDAIEFIKAHEPKSQYEANLKVAVQSKMVDYRNIGLVASLIPFFQKDLAKRIERANGMKELQGSKHFGEVGKREVFTLVVDGEHTFDSRYSQDGLSLYRMRDMDGNVAVWWTASGSLEVGGVYRVKATIKKHDVYKEIAQTVLTRCKVENKVEKQSA